MVSHYWHIYETEDLPKDFIVVIKSALLKSQELQNAAIIAQSASLHMGQKK